MASATRGIALVAVAACASRAAAGGLRTHRQPNFEPPSGLAVMPFDHPGAAMVELFEWTWPDVARECEEWLSPKGFTAVQVSPANAHVAQLEWWARYKLVTFELVSRSGDEKAFTDMVQRCNKVGVGIYVDVVFNHVTDGHGLSMAGHVYGNRSTPIFKQSDLHHDKHDLNKNCRVTNYKSKFNVQHCDLYGLPDLCTGCAYVQQRVSAYLTKLVEI